MATTTSLLGLKKPAYTDAADIEVINGNMDAIDAAIGERTYPHNLLVNSYFPSSCVINQRGVTTWTPSSYNIDMWYQNAHGTVTNTAEGIRIDNTAGTATAIVMQYVQKYKDNEDYTFIAKVNGNIVYRMSHFSGTTAESKYSYSTYEGGYIGIGYASGKGMQVTFRCDAGYAITVEWAALYQGAYRYVLPEYVWKGYAAEVAECQRYYTRFGTYVSTGFCGVGVKIDDTKVRVTFPVAVRMAKNPSVSYGGVRKIQTAEVTAMGTAEADGNVINVGCSCDASSMSYNTPLMLWMSSGSWVAFSAEP